MSAPYAEVEDVLAHAGDIARAWSETSRPSLAHIEGFIDETVFLLDAFIGARGLATPVEAEGVREALREPVAMLALQKALHATPGAAPDGFTAYVDKWADDLWASLAAKTSPLLVIIDSAGGSEARAADAQSHWTDDAADVLEGLEYARISRPGASYHSIRKEMRL